jgi:hypothetical protein
MNIDKNEAEASLRALLFIVEVLEELQASHSLVGLHTTPALDLSSLECSSHRGLRSIIR